MERRTHSMTTSDSAAIASRVTRSSSEPTIAFTPNDSNALALSALRDRTVTSKRFAFSPASSRARTAPPTYPAC